MPPPSRRAELPLIVLSVIVRSPLLLRMPPPLAPEVDVLVSELPLIVLPVIVSFRSTSRCQLRRRWQSCC